MAKETKTTITTTNAEKAAETAAETTNTAETEVAETGNPKMYGMLTREHFELLFSKSIEDNILLQFLRMYEQQYKRMPDEMELQVESKENELCFKVVQGESTVYASHAMMGRLF